MGTRDVFFVETVSGVRSVDLCCDCVEQAVAIIKCIGGHYMFFGGLFSDGFYQMEIGGLLYHVGDWDFPPHLFGHYVAGIPSRNFGPSQRQFASSQMDGTRSTVSKLHCSSDGHLLGVLTFFGHLWLQWARQLQIWDVGPKSLAIAGGIAVFSGFLPAILFSIRHVYTFGNMIVYEFVGTNGQYPTDPDRLFSIQLTTKMFAISYPLLILTLIAVLFLSLSVAARRRRRRLATEGGVE